MKLMKLFPKSRPYQKGYFRVSKIHQLYYALYGNPKGIPVLFVHGGPGAGCGNDAYQHFNPKKFNILTIDQRGAEKSKPYAEIKENNTKYLVDDFVKFLDFLKIKKTYLFGGSWGSFLSLCFAIKHPERVSGMVLRGIHLGSNLKNDYMFAGGPKTHFPEVWESFVKHAPNKKNVASSYLPKMFSKNKKIVEKYCKLWSTYELSLLHLNYDPKKIFKEFGKTIGSLARLEGYYISHNCFMPNNYIIKNTDKIKNIPLSLIQGRYDFICPPTNAYKLHKAIPKSRLFFVTSGHSSEDLAMQDRMMREIDRMAKR